MTLPWRQARKNVTGRILACLALQADEVHGALGNPQGGELAIVHHGLKRF